MLPAMSVECICKTTCVGDCGVFAALKTELYAAEEYHLFLVTDIYFDIFCIDCIVKSAENQTCIV